MSDKSTQKPTIPTPITWETHEYLHTEKDHDWYWALGLIAVAGSVGALLFSNVLFAVLILVAAFVLAIFAARVPDVATFTISQRGVRINDALYPYQALSSFSIDETDGRVAKLILEPKSLFALHITIPLEGVDVDHVHDFLLRYLVEEEHREPLTHRVMEYLGF